jgi:hypothetical protein
MMRDWRSWFGLRCFLWGRSEEVAGLGCPVRFVDTGCVWATCTRCGERRLRVDCHRKEP